MARGELHIYSYDTAAGLPVGLGKALQVAVEGRSVMIIRFFQAVSEKEACFLRRMEPELKVFCFERSCEEFDGLTQEKKQERIVTIRNGMSFAKKVLTTGECDLLILDGVSGLVERGILSVPELRTILECREETDVILTGVRVKENVCALGDVVYKIRQIKCKLWK